MVEKKRPALAADELLAPPIDRVGEDMAKARIQGALFGSSVPATLERYTLLKRLGEGSFGAVYSAWDPRMDRKVALKILHGGATTELEREARALAKLSHPNVVTIHDVGGSGGELFLAMEFVDGAPLSALDTTPLGWRRIVEVYRQAAAGLAAAHSAGVVHRDFKPANAVLGRDGRVRILDFGLARESLTNTEASGPSVQTRPAGTPRYMAPEQHGGAPASERTDQYCFCVALWEALHGEPAFDGKSEEALLAAKQAAPIPPRSTSVPARVSRVLHRGLAPVPGDRFPSLLALDAALGRTLERRTQVFAAVGLGGVALATGIGLGGAEQPCLDADAPPQRWTDSTREAITTAFARTQVPHAPDSGRTALTVLDAWADDWVGARADACLQHTKGIQSAEGLDLRTSCLDLQRARFDALLDVFLQADTATVDKAVTAAFSLPPPSACADIGALRAAHPVSAESRTAVSSAAVSLARARAELAAGQYARATKLANPIVTLCAEQEIEHPPTCVDATLVQADAASRTGDHMGALRGLRKAAVDAQRAQLPEAFALAAAGLTWELGEIDAAFDTALTWAALGRASLHEQLDSPVWLVLLNAEGSVLFSAGRWDEATAAHQRRLDALDQDSPLRFHSLGNLANVDNGRGRIKDAEAVYARAIELGTEAFGASHPQVLMTRQNRSGMLAKAGGSEEVLVDLRDVLAMQRIVLGDTHPGLAKTLVNISLAQFNGGDTEAALRSAIEAKALVRAAYGESSVLEIEARTAESDALIALGRPDEAVRTSETAAKLAETLLGTEHATTAFALRSWGAALRATGKENVGLEKLRAAKSLFMALDMPAEAAATDVD